MTSTSTTIFKILLGIFFLAVTTLLILAIGSGFPSSATNEINLLWIGLLIFIIVPYLIAADILIILGIIYFGKEKPSCYNKLFHAVLFGLRLIG